MSAMTDVVTVLRDARALLARPGGWCKGTMEKPGHGYAAYCIRGAVAEAAAASSFLPSIRALEAAAPADVLTLATFNDLPSTRKRDVLNLLDRAIAQAEAAS